MLHSPLFCVREPFPAVPCQYFLAGDFLYTKFCVQTRVKPPPYWLFRAVRAESPPMGGDLSAGRRVPVPHARTLEDETSFTAEPGQPDDGGDARRRARKEHTARQAERARQRREDDRRDSGDGRARAPRATDFGQRPKDAGGCAPAPAKISGRVRPPKGEARRGEGGSAPRARRGKGNDPTRNRAQRPAPPPTKRRNSRQRQRPEARRGRERGQEAGRQPAEGTQIRARPAAKPPRPTTERRPAGAEAAPPRPTPQHGANHASGRRNGGETDGDGAGRAETGRESQAAAPPPAQKKTRQNATARARPTRRPRTTAATGGSTHARRAGAPCANAQTASEQRAQRANARQAGGRAKARTRPPREAAGAAARPPPSQTPRAARTQRAARPIVARRCGHFRAGGMRGTLPSAFPLPSLVRFTGMGGVIAPRMQKNAQKGEKTRIWGLRCV